MPILNMIYWATWWGGGWWQPTDAFCWYKFDWDYTDSTSSFWNATWTATFQTLDSWIQVLQTDWSNIVTLPSWVTSNAMTTYTIAFWMKVITTSPTYWYYMWCGDGNNSWMAFYESTAWRNYYEWGNNVSRNTRDITPSWIWAWWRLVCLRSNWTGRNSVSLLINWQYSSTSGGSSSTDSSSIFWYSSWPLFAIWWRNTIDTWAWSLTSVQISNFVISTSYWDDTTCLDMYDQTKANYWF